jgi:hypothetical protein
LLRSLQEIQPFLMEEDCGGGQGLSWAVEPRRERERKSQSSSVSIMTGYRLDDRFSVTGRGTKGIFFLLPLHSDQLWVSYVLLSSLPMEQY